MWFEHPMPSTGVPSPPVGEFRFGHWSVPMANLILGSLLAISNYAARRRAGRLMRAQLGRSAGI